MPRILTAGPRPVNVVILTFIVALLVASAPASAQRRGNRVTQPGSGSAGGSIFWDLSGDGERLGSKDGTVGPLWLVYGTVFVTPRIAIGAEYSTLGTLETSISNPVIGNYLYSSKSSALYGVARVRVVRGAEVSVDILGGIGGQFSHREYHYSSAAAANSYDSSDSANYLSYLAGVEMPLAAARHVCVSPYARFYFLRGLPHQPEEPPSRQTAVGAGITVAFKW